ncbi:MerR family transcriptional regulator [Pseudazoarcus pumilus]|uniref:MerR family transcriptional regulator n=2 Tax=Pseudazoarcus pumilus TaxID=2067960 RepID=A0A2I6S5M9_9RHOO|nr:MerR family transcriptional regulator [Pseudazoarcus pumilus]
MNKDGRNEVMLNIAAVERDTGLAKDTLRVWERRYGFPTPIRDEHGNRLYSPADVEKLRIIRRLLDQGRRPARLVRASTRELLDALQETEAQSEDHPIAAVREADFLQLVKLHRSIELRSALQQMLLRHGLQRFVADTVAELNTAVGQAWMRGELEVPEEHLYSEQVQNVIRNAIGSHPGAGERPRVLLTTFPEELHSLGILMVEAMLAPEGATCVSLGTQTPPGDICRAAVDGRFDVVALSFSSAYPQRQAGDGLAQLRQQLPAGIELWAGGAGIAGKPPRIEGVRVIRTLDEAVDALREWRAAHATP